MNRLIVVSNRLLFALDSLGDDPWTVTPAVGGLVSAVEPMLRERGGTWIGWPGIAGEIPNENVFRWVDSFLAAGSQLARRILRRRRNL